MTRFLLASELSEEEQKAVSAPWPYRRQRLARLFQISPEEADDLEAVTALQSLMVDYIESLCALWASAEIGRMTQDQYEMISEFLWGETK